MTRTIYRSLLGLHPRAFRERFAGEMLWLFDETLATEGAAALLFDGLLSLARQWLLRRMTWKVAVALLGGVLEIGLVLALSRAVYPARAGALPRLAPGAATTEVSAAPAAGLTVQHRAANAQIQQPPVRKKKNAISDNVPAGPRPLGFLVLFGIVLIYAVQNVPFQPGGRGRTGPLGRRGATPGARRPPRVAKSPLSISPD